MDIHFPTSFIQEPPEMVMPVGGTLLAEESILTLTDSNYVASTALNINTGVYAGGGPATKEGSTLSLPATFNTDAGITAYLNGQEIKKGTDVIRVSSTQISLSIGLTIDDQVKIRMLS